MLAVNIDITSLLSVGSLIKKMSKIKSDFMIYCINFLLQQADISNYSKVVLNAGMLYQKHFYHILIYTSYKHHAKKLFPAALIIIQFHICIFHCSGCPLVACFLLICHVVVIDKLEKIFYSF